VSENGGIPESGELRAARDQGKLRMEAVRKFSKEKRKEAQRVYEE